MLGFPDRTPETDQAEAKEPSRNLSDDTVRFTDLLIRRPRNGVLTGRPGT